MQVPETDVIWPYSLLKATENKSTSRTGLESGAASELVGVDGSVDGGLKPFPGFRELYRFAPETAVGTFGLSGWSGSNPYTGAAHRSKVVDFWSFSVIAGASTRVWGFVYVVRRPSNLVTPECNDNYDLLMDFEAPNGTTTPSWKTVILKEGLPDAGVLSNTGKAVMSVESTGKAVYVFIRGRAPIAVYFRATDTSTTDAILVPEAGPGKRINAKNYGSDFGPSATHANADFPNPTTAGLAPGSVVFAYTSHNSGASLSTISNFATAPQLPGGSYSLAVQYEDSRSGRKSQICNNVDMSFTSPHRIFVDGNVDNTKFDTVNIYRSVRTDNAAGAYTGGILQLEASITIFPASASNYDINDTQADAIIAGTPPTGTNITYWRYAYQLTDSALVMQDVFLNKPSFYETMPKGGAGALFDSTMLVGNISESPGDLTGTGETRWSSSTDESVELFTARGEYRPSNVGDAVTVFKRTGQIMAGFTRNGVQFFSKDNGFIRVVAAHAGYGVVGPYAAATVGPVTYYLNYRGLKAIYPDGRLDDVQAIDDLVIDEWYSGTTGAQELTKVSMAFDPATLCLYILNPTRANVALFWFSTGSVTELQDMDFSKVTQGWWKDTDGQLVPRALLLKNAPFPDAVTNTSFRPAVYMPCRTYGDKAYPDPSADPPVYMLEFEGDHLADISSQTANTFQQYDGSCTRQTYTNQGIELRAAGNNPFGAGSAASAARQIGSWVYGLNGATKGDKGIIYDATSSYVRIYFPAGNAKTWDVVALDPIYFKWVGSPLRTSEDKAEEFVVKQPSSMGCVFSDVKVNVGKEIDYRQWRALLYRENDEDPLISVYPTNPDGTEVNKSIVRGDSPNWAAFGKHGYLGQWFTPGVEIHLPNVEYRLVGVQVKGRMLPTDRTRRTF
jgi:hypothetical protein